MNTSINFKIGTIFNSSFSRNFQLTNNKIRQLGNSIKRDRNALNQLNRSIKASSKAGLSVKKLTSDYNQLKNKIGLASREQNLLRREIRMSKKASMSFAKVYRQAMGLFVTGMTIGYPIKKAMDFEDAMAGVAKVMNLSRAQTITYGREILSLSTKIPLATDEIAQLYTAGGRLNLSGKQLRDFATSAGKMAIAFDMSAIEASDAMSKMRTSMSLSQKQVEQLGDIINVLDNTIAGVQASEIVDIMKRVGALGKTSGLSAKQVASLGASLVSLGTVPETASRAMKRMFITLNTLKPANAKSFKAMGLDIKYFSKLMKKDAMGAILLLLKKLKKNKNSIGIIADLFGQNFAGDIVKLANNYGVLENSLSKVSDKTKYLGSMTSEYLVKQNTLKNKLKLFRNSFNKLAVTIGNIVIPMLKKITDKLIPTISKIGDFIYNNKSLIASLGKTALTIGGVMVAMRLLNFAVSSNPIVFAFKAVVTIVALIIANFKEIKKFFTDAWKFYNKFIHSVAKKVGIDTVKPSGASTSFALAGMGGIGGAGWAKPVDYSKKTTHNTNNVTVNVSSNTHDKTALGNEVGNIVEGKLNGNMTNHTHIQD